MADAINLTDEDFEREPMTEASLVQTLRELQRDSGEYEFINEFTQILNAQSPGSYEAMVQAARDFTYKKFNDLELVEDFYMVKGSQKQLLQEISEMFQDAADNFRIAASRVR